MFGIYTPYHPEKTWKTQAGEKHCREKQQKGRLQGVILQKEQMYPKQGHKIRSDKPEFHPCSCGAICR